MIKIEKSKEIPLSIRGLPAPADPKKINHKLYSGADVRKQLAKDQNYLCAYCGCRIYEHYSHIEHYRPKGGYTTARLQKVVKPGYYWRVYAWQNMLLSCPACNTSFKKNRFDLKDERLRDILHRDLSREEPMLINPATEDPAEHLEFDRYLIKPRKLNGKESERGKYTIELLQLNDREDLVANRRRAWLRYRRITAIMRIAERAVKRYPEDRNIRAIRQIARTYVRHLRASNAEFSFLFRHVA